MAKKTKNSVKSKSNKTSKVKNKMNLITIKGNKKRAIKKTFYDKNEYVTDLSFIDKYEEDEKKRMKIKDNENLIRFQNKRLYILKICFRPLTNNIELLGNYIEETIIDNNALQNNNANIDNNKNKCSYLLMQDNNIVAPISNDILINNDNSNINNNINENSNENEKKENIGNQKIKKKKRIRKSIVKKTKNKFFYLHICSKNIINCLLLNECSIINYILIFLSGIYTGYFEEIKKNNSITLKVDTFNIFLNINNSINIDDYYKIEVLGKGKDEYGEYVIKGNMKLINNLILYQKENNITENINDKVINFGNILFHKIYNK